MSTHTENTPDADVPRGTPLGPAPIGPPPADGAAVDAREVEDARREIQELVREIAQLARSDIQAARFYEELLKRTLSALAAEGGAVWTRVDGKLNLVYQINLDAARLAEPARQQQHEALLAQVMQSGEDLLLPARSGSGDGQGPVNPTDYLLLFGVLKHDDGVEGVVEILQRSGTRPATQRGYLRFVHQVCELAGDYLRARRLRSYSDKETLWEQLESFAQRVHKKLETGRVAYTIANEGRRLLRCDRVSVVVRRGRTYRVAAVSGQDSFDKRSNVITRLAALASAVGATGEALWYTGSTHHLPPQVEKTIEAYVDLSHARTVAVLPLLQPAEEEDAPHAKRPVIGALVVEQIQEDLPDDGLPMRVEVVARHSASALSNALEHESLFLLPLWRAIGKMRWVIEARTLPKTLTIAGLLFAAVLALVVIPADFEIESRGVLQPAQRREVFAGIDGVVIDVPVEHARQVAAGELLAELRNTDLEVQITDLVGRREATIKQMRTIERALLGETRLSAEEQNRLSGQLLQLRKTHETLGLQLDLYRQKQTQLKVTSPIDGQIVTWQVRERLLRRPVRQGQILMSVADPNGPWELELHVPEDRMGHIVKAAKAQSGSQQVTYILATNPGVSHGGRVREVHAAAEVRGEEGNIVLVRVEIDKSELDDLRPGATVMARIDCGRRPLGYVWLHDLFAFVQSKILFRL